MMTLFSFSSPSSFSCCLEKFVAQSVGMEEKGVMALAKFVNERAPLLHSLDLGGNQIGDEGGCILLDLLPCASSSSSPSSSSFAFVEGRVGGGVWRLALRGNMLGDNFAARCAHLFQNASPPLSSPLSSISRPSSLVEVSVGDNAFSPSVALEMLRSYYFSLLFLVFLFIYLFYLLFIFLTFSYLFFHQGSFLEFLGHFI